MKRLGTHPAGAEAAGRECMIVEGFFPLTVPPDWSLSQWWSDPGQSLSGPPFIMEELTATARKLQSGKARGLDGIINEVLSEVIKWNSVPVLHAVNVCLRSCVFPTRWKRGRITLLYKGPPRRLTVQTLSGQFPCWTGWVRSSGAYFSIE